MKKAVFSAAICLSLLCVCSLVHAQETALDTNKYFPLKQGSVWTYLEPETGETFMAAVDGTGKLCRQECVRFVGSDGSETYFTKSGTGVSLARIVRPDDEYAITFCPPIDFVPAQIEAGAMACTIMFQGAITEGTGSSEGWYLLMVEGLTDVEVPAGSFTDCLQVTLIIRSNNHPKNPGTFERQTVWLAPNVGIVRWTESYVKGTTHAAIKGRVLQSYSK